MRSIAIDIGNTRAKLALFEEQELLEVSHASSSAPEAVLQWCRQQQASHAIVASVSKAAEELVSVLSAHMQVFLLQPGLPLPIQINYATPATLGVDRIAAAVGGAALHPAAPVLVFDAGTCLTHEFVSAEGIYEGGAISPGLHMRLNAMHTFTARLPLLALDTQHLPLPTGKSTAACMQSGAYWGMLYEIEGTLLRYKKIYPTLKVILCGGDAKTFENKLKEHIFVVSELVLYGLNEILRYNVLQNNRSAPAV